MLLLVLLPGDRARAAPTTESEPEICVIAPRVESDADGRVGGTVPNARPTLVVAEPLGELRIERGGQRPWSAQIPASQRAGTAIPWPLAPLKPGELAVLRLRPRGTAAGHFASVRLRAAAAPVLRSSEQLVARLGRDPRAWERAVEGALARGQVPMAWALLFDPRAPASPPLQGLRAELLSGGCGPGGG
ncbi:hypothetical protein [Cyanobium sp. ATX 6F1]|uniref:hypothetical protein n=1 Tax=unclassified Cyanobium TaxID=2627006 RepID=UPI0020CEF56E|nr:hypothetical protein [Cyanobium sp. ATX 6F1]MCP9915944.1 hypothetical protein [Cyanobium sp. ATX 6F1]